MIYIKRSFNLLPRLQRMNFRFISGLNLWNEEISSEIKLKIESHWRNKITIEQFDENDTKRDKYYVLSMFPYPSGFLHMGHVRVYTISDSIARFQRMNGKNVIHPIGWDAFGLPAENAALDRQIAPHEWTETNIAKMKAQLQELGCSFEWDRELATCDPNYYRWTQYLFLKLYESGLVYQKEAYVNWDPVDQTVLADEQVDENGCSWRSGAKVEKKFLRQWFVRTTRFAKDLLDGLDDSVLHDWKDIINLQKHWIGECNGVSFDFKLVGAGNQFLTLWTPTPEYIRDAKFVAVSDKHIFAQEEGEILHSQTKKLQLLLENPLNGEKIPVFITNEIDFLLGTDSYLGIPGICEEASKFADKYNIKYSVPNPVEENVKYEICDLAKKLNIGGYWTSAKLRDWLISRQRYWGTPIPIIHCGNCGSQPVKYEDLPISLPKLSKLSQKGVPQLAQLSDWVNTTCPTCQGPAKRETDTMDTFVDSSWYYLRYLDPKNDRQIFDIEKAKTMTPVDLYIGGKEHAVLHLYYARFMSHFLHSAGMLPEREPFKRLLVQGMVMGRSFRVKGSGQYLLENKVQIVDIKRNKAVVPETGEPVVIAWEKMSKSKHNGTDPDDMFREYGTDTTRLLILADVAPTSNRHWNSNTFPGVLNWQKRLWLTMRDFLDHRTNLPPQIAEDEFKAHDDYLFDSRNYYIKGTTFNYCIAQQHSIAVSKQQGLTNSLRKSPPAVYAYSLQFERALSSQIILLAPMAPHFASELWSGFVSAPNRLNRSAEIDWDKSVLEQKWPQLDNNYNLDLVCQLNGIEVCVVKIPQQEIEKLTKEDAIEIALKQAEVQKYTNNNDILNIKCSVCENYETVVNVRTKFIKSLQAKKKKKKEGMES